jgi:hypothetical protein
MEVGNVNVCIFWQKPKMIFIKSVWMAFFSWSLLTWDVWIYD